MGSDMYATVSSLSQKRAMVVTQFGFGARTRSVVWKAYTTVGLHGPHGQWLVPCGLGTSSLCTSSCRQRNDCTGACMRIVERTHTLSWTIVLYTRSLPLPPLPATERTQSNRSQGHLDTSSSLWPNRTPHVNRCSLPPSLRQSTSKGPPWPGSRHQP
jgi:hypothetical protein